MSDQKQILASQILQISQNPSQSPYLQFVKGDRENTSAQRAVDHSKAGPETLCFVSSAEDLLRALSAKASIIIALDHAKPASQNLTSPQQVLFSTPNVGAAMALVLPLFDRKAERFYAGVHPQSFVDPSAKLGAGVSVGPFAVIGAFAEVGDGALIGAQTVIERGAKIGAKTILHPQVFVGAHCVIGKACEIHSHTSIGSDGFGYVQGPDKKRRAIPQLGIVVLEDHVDVGANCAIDRATLGETRIGEGSKFDNFCHIGHNCKIGKNGAFAGGFMVAGSTEIGDDCMSGGGTLVTDHVKLCSGVVLGGRTSVTKDVSVPGVYAGYPLQHVKDAMRTLANLVHLTKMRKQLARIEKQLHLNSEESK